VIEVQAHQVLHGYRSGHGQIAASIKLAKRDSELLTRLSDLSGSLSSGLQLDSYLTVYPLPSQKFFALARTWPDPQASRAGCVLTHTILIPMDSWATLTNVRSLSPLFQNPHSAPEYDFSEPLSFQTRMHTPSPSSAKADGVAARTFVARYFGLGLRPIVWFNPGEPEEYLWRLLQHLWPKLRSVFSCCTFSLQQRNLDDRPFDLLFAPSSVYSRFAKLSAEHFIEPTLDRHIAQIDAEPWCQYWADALFSLQPDLPERASDLPVWNELGEDPTALRKLSLVQELRLRAAQSPTAGVGAIDVVESLALGPDAALLLKRHVLTDAIEAAASAQSPQDALTSLRLIDDRLRRESFRNVVGDFESRLTSAAARVTKREPEAALQVSATWLADSVAGSKSAFVQGVMLGLRELANKEPSRLTILRSYPTIAAEIFRLEPTFAGTYLQVGGDAAPGILAGWLTSTRDAEALRLVRKSVLPVLRRPDDEELLSPLLRDIGDEDVKETLSTLSDISEGFSTQAIRNVVADRISSAYPSLVRQWASETPSWSTGVSKVVASTYQHNRQGFVELLEESNLSSDHRAEVLSVMICDQMSSSCPHWLRELASRDVRLVSTLLFTGSQISETIDAGLSKLLTEVTDLPLASSVDLLTAVLNFHGRPVFPLLLDSAMRSVVTSYVTASIDAVAAQNFLNNPNVIGWLTNVSAWQLTTLLSQGCQAGSYAVANAWKWISDAPGLLYQRRPSVLPEVFDSLILYTSQTFPQGAEVSLIHVLRRSKSEVEPEVRQALAAKTLRFALDNIRLPLGAVVAEIFADVYSVVARKDSRPPSLWNILFGSYDWDKAKDLRVSLVDAFLRSNWPPGDLAIAASNAGILPKIFKRLHRAQRGDDYLRTMLQDLSQRHDPGASKVGEHLGTLIADPDFYEEWD